MFIRTGIKEFKVFNVILNRTAKLLGILLQKGQDCDSAGGNLCAININLYS